MKRILLSWAVGLAMGLALLPATSQAAPARADRADAAPKGPAATTSLGQAKVPPKAAVANHPAPVIGPATRPIIIASPSTPARAQNQPRTATAKTAKAGHPATEPTAGDPRATTPTGAARGTIAGTPRAGSTAGTTARATPPVTASGPATPPAWSGPPLKRPFKAVERFIDVRDLLSHISQQAGLSLMVGHGVRGNLDDVAGDTLQDVLDQVLIPREFEWRLFENCLYVAERGQLDELWKVMNQPLKAKITRGKRLNAEFRNIDLSMICSILRKYSGIEIRTTDHITGNMTLRIIDMPWERVLLGIVYLNGFRMMETDFSIVISP